MTAKATPPCSGLAGRDAPLRPSRRLAALLACAACAVSSVASGQPSGQTVLVQPPTPLVDHRVLHAPNVWRLAADPGAMAAERACQTAESVLDMFAPSHLQSGDGRSQLESALQALESVRALEAKDVRLRFYAGRILMLLHEDSRAVGALESALGEASEHPMAVDAFFSLAVSYAKLGRRVDEVSAYGEYLRRETDPSSRARGFSNRAESELAMEQYTEALRDYQLALELAPEDPYIHWGYAVALDRTGDPAASASEAKAAIRLDPLDEQIHKPSVFFVPAYDRYWYEGLGAMVRATLTDDAASAGLWWDTARAKWMVYEAAAGPSDRWYLLAKAHRITCERALAAGRSSRAGAGARARGPATAKP